MNPDATAQKAEIRSRVRALLRAMPVEQKRADSEQACARLGRQQVWQQAKTVLFYAPLADEPDVWPLLLEAFRAGKLVALPRFDGPRAGYEPALIKNPDTDLVVGKLGIREPAPHCGRIAGNQIDLVLVPGVAFDVHGHRLGRGKGYYDRLLPALGGVKCGVAFDEQVLEDIPAEPHDYTLQFVLTPTRWIVARS